MAVPRPGARPTPERQRARPPAQHPRIQARTARSAALINLAADLPAAVLADLLGLHINTAVRWVKRARRDWADYLAARADATGTGQARNLADGE